MMIFNQNERKDTVRYAVQKQLWDVVSVVMTSIFKKHFSVAQFLAALAFNLTLKIHIDK